MSIGFVKATALAALFLITKGLCELALLLFWSQRMVDGAFPPLFKLTLSITFIVPLLLIVPFFWRRIPGFSEPMVKSIWRQPMPWLLLIVPLPFATQVIGSQIETWSHRLLPGGYDNYMQLLELVGPTGSLVDLIGAYLTIGVIGPLVEEILYRGVVLSFLLQTARSISQRGGRSNWPIHLAVFLQALLFGLSHLNLWQIVYAVPMGLLFGYLALWTGGLLAPVLVHIFNNVIAVAILYHFPNNPFFLTSGESMEPSDMPWWLLAPAALFLVVALRLLWQITNRAREEAKGGKAA